VTPFKQRESTDNERGNFVNGFVINFNSIASEQTLRLPFKLGMKNALDSRPAARTRGAGSQSF